MKNNNDVELISMLKKGDQTRMGRKNVKNNRKVEVYYEN